MKRRLPRAIVAYPLLGVVVLLIVGAWLRRGPDLDGRDVLIVEDIVDSGLTLSYLRKNLLSRNPASLDVCALLVREGLQASDTDLRYVGFHIPPAFVIGYGLDLAERYRNLPYVATYVGGG